MAAYHLEALRKQRVLERAVEARERMEEQASICTLGSAQAASNQH
jgi:hypothetical protein